MLVPILKTLRPHQWVKNLFVALPLVFAKRLLDHSSALRAAAAVGLFCALSGAVYLLNDVADIDKDRAHPKKKQRPIASGRLPVGVALALAAALALGALAGGLALDWRFAAVAGGYVVNNLLYSFWLKHVAFVDVLSIAAGFFLRVLGGAFAIDVASSGWLLAVTSLMAAFLAFGKRTHELAAAARETLASPTYSGPLTSSQIGKTRRVLEKYKLEQLRMVVYVFGALTSAAYVAYTLSGHTQRFFHTRWMWLSAPFCLVGIGRFVWLVSHAAHADSPTDAMLRDPPFVINLVLWAACITALIYQGMLG